MVRLSRSPSVRPVAFALLIGLGSCASFKPKPSQQDTAAWEHQQSEAGEPSVKSGAAPSYPGATRYITTLGLPATSWGAPPDWIANPGMTGVLGALGVAGRNDFGTREQLDEARLAARLEMAHMLEMRLQRVGRADLEQYLGVIHTGDQLLADNDSRKSNLAVERDITDLVLSGSRQQALWFDPSNGDCYVWLVMDGSVPRKANHTVENGVSVYVANTDVGGEYRPEWPSAPEPVVVPVAPAPTPEKSPTEKLEEALAPIETIPVGAKKP